MIELELKLFELHGGLVGWEGRTLQNCDGGVKLASARKICEFNTKLTRRTNIATASQIGCLLRGDPQGQKRCKGRPIC
jgi:hypothetical protein